MSLLTERKCTAYVCSEAVRPQEVFHPCFFLTQKTPDRTLSEGRPVSRQP